MTSFAPLPFIEARRTSLLLRAILHKLFPLRADDLLIDSLLKTIKVRLSHAKLHLVSLLLAFKSLRCRSTSKPFASCHGRRWPRVYGGRWRIGGGLRKYSGRQSEQPNYYDRVQQKSQTQPPIR